jgi:hypothetical protein
MEQREMVSQQPAWARLAGLPGLFTFPYAFLSKTVKPGMREGARAYRPWNAPPSAHPNFTQQPLNARQDRA